MQLRPGSCDQVVAPGFADYVSTLQLEVGQQANERF